MNDTNDFALDMISRKLEEGVAEIFKGENYQRYLKTLSYFRKYSLNNSLLIFMQRPDATLVTSYSNWKKLNRYVNKGEKAIRILAPLKKKKDKTEGNDDDDDIILGYRAASVFDVSQTNGSDVCLSLAKPLETAVDNYQLFIDALLLASPVKIHFNRIEGETNGFYRPIDKDIVVKEGMSESQTVKTVLHEIAHAIMHAQETERNERTRIRQEIEAESVAYSVSSYYGIDTSEYSFNYIATWSSSSELPELKNSLQTIRSTSSRLIETINSIISPGT